MREEYDHYASEAISLLRGLISKPSTSRNETEACDYLCGYLSDKGLKYSRHQNNAWIIPDHYDASKPTILLNAHIDTVKPVEGWTMDPYSGEINDGILYGLGSNDCGGGLVSLLQVYRILCDKEEPYNLIYLASAEEEVSGKNGIESVIPLLPEIDFAIVGEPTCMQPAIAEKGLMVLDITEHGKSGHAARNEGINAIYLAMDDIESIRSCDFPNQSELLGPVKCTVTIINSGTQHNVIPDTCTFTVDVRSNECYSNKEIYEKIRSITKGEVKARSFRLNSSGIPTTHPFVERAMQHGLHPFGSPTLSDQALMPFPSVKIGPGDSSRSHTANEYIKISEIEAAIPLYIELLDKLSLK